MQLPAADWRTIVDVGCGTGLSTIAVADRRADFHLAHVPIVGLDSSDTQVEAARKNNARPNVTYE